MTSELETTPSQRSGDLETVAAFLRDVADESCRKRLTGVAIGVIVDGQELMACSGWADVDSQRPVAADTVFEIGSLSKLFTSLLLAVSVTKQEVSLDDPVQTALGEAVTVPSDGNSQITYRSLANHRSSLPRLPDDLLASADMENPYAHYDQERLYACLNKMESVKPIGSRGEYSNLGVGLLGHVLGKLAGSDYRVALKDRVLAPLGMRDTSAQASQEQAAQLATAHKKRGKPTKHWDFTEVTAAAGGVRSSLADMMKLLRANLRPEESELSEALMMMREPSSLPESEPIKPPFLPVDYLVPLGFAFTIILILDVVAYLLLRKTPDVMLYVAALATIGAAIRWGKYAGAAVLASLTLGTWWQGGDGLRAVTLLIFGASLISVGSAWKRIRQELFEQRGGGEGRLAWQTSEVGAHRMLWHNGMVGGSASFLGIVEELGIGVVVLTNTAKLVDATGMKVLMELVNLKENAPCATSGE